MKKLIPISFLLSALGASVLGLSTHKEAEKIEGEFTSPGMVAYAASYSSSAENEPQYSTQNSKTFQYLNLGPTLSQYRGDSVKVGIIDSGINYDHEDFMVNSSYKTKGDSKYFAYQTSGWVYYKASQHGYSYLDDTLGHGTNVAATVAAAINGVGGTGLAPNVELYVYKVTNSNNGYEFGAIQNALIEAKNLKLDVVNMSFQSYEHEVTYGSSTMPASSGCSSVLSTYLNSAYNAGVTLVGAAGNYNTNEPSYPGSNNHVINVGSLNSSGTGKAGFSNYGNSIDIVAPGYVHVADKGTNSSYKDTQGTSFSAPLVTAAIALYKQKHPTAKPSEIESALYASCDPIDDSGSPYTNWAGNGKLNVARFLGLSDSDYPTDIVINNPEVIDDNLELEVGNTFDLDWTVNGVGVFDKSVSFSTYSETEDVLSVDSNGRITALNVGEEMVIIKSNENPEIEKNVWVTIKPTSEPVVSSVTVSPSILNLDLNGTNTGNLSATVNGYNNPSQQVTWSSSDTDVATVSPTGVVTGLGEGTATIVATSQQDNTKSGECEVNVIAHQAPSATTQYQLITSTDDLEVGQSYLIASAVSSNKIKTLSTSPANNNIPTTELSVSSNKVTRGSSAMSVTLGGSSTGYTFKTDNCSNTNGYLNATSTTSDNYLRVVSTLDKYAYFTISFSSNAAVITCTGKTSRNIIRYNSNNTIISCYSSGQNPVYLWKEIKVKTLKSISVKTEPNKTIYEEGDLFNPAGLVITKKFSDNTTEDASYASESSNFSFTPSLNTGLLKTNSEVQITYGGKSCSQSISVVSAKVLASISIENYTTAFIEGDAFIFGGTVTANFADSSNSDVTESATFSGYNMTVPGNYQVTVSYTYKGTTKTQNYNITVAVGVLSSIAVSGMTTEYQKNADFSFDGTCTATFENGYQKTVTPTEISSPDMSKSGEKTVNLSYTYAGVTKSTSYVITVVAYREVIEETTTSIYGTYNFSKISGTSQITTTSTITGCYSSAGGITTASVGSISNIYAKSGYIRLATGGATGSIIFAFGSNNITDITIVARGWSSSEQQCTMSITNGGTVRTTSDSVDDTFNVKLTPATNEITFSASKNNRICIKSITFYKTTKTSQDIGHSEDCVGLEAFIDNNLHMDYKDNLEYCKDNEHHYYSTAKTAFNALNEHQRSLFTSNSAYLTEWTRLSTWASKNGDSLNASNLLASNGNLTIDLIKNTNIVGILVIISLISVSSIGAYFMLKRRKEN